MAASRSPLEIILLARTAQAVLACQATGPQRSRGQGPPKAARLGLDAGVSGGHAFSTDRGANNRKGIKGMTL